MRRGGSTAIGLTCVVLAVARCGGVGSAAGNPARVEARPQPDAGSGSSGSPDGGQAGGVVAIPKDDCASGAASPETVRLSVKLVGAGSGRIESQPAGIACPGHCCAAFDKDSKVTLFAASDPGSALAYWAGGCRGRPASCTLSAWQDFDIIAAFEPPPPVAYSLRVIPKANKALALNSTGNATGVGYGGPQNANGDGFLFDAATGLSSYLPFSYGEASYAQGINDRNALVVNVITGLNELKSRTIRWENGVATALATIGPPDSNTWGYAINASNEVVGWFVFKSLGRGLTYDRAFLHDGQRMIDLGSLDGTCSEAYAINSAGTAVGISCAPGLSRHAVVFHRGGPIEDLTPDSWGSADGISDTGYVVGRAGYDGFIREPDGSMRNVGSLSGGSGSWLHGVNDAGIAVGVAFVPSYFPQGFTHAGEPDDASRAAVWMNGRLWDLAYMTGRSDLWLLDAQAINGSGQILAKPFSCDGEACSLLLTPR